MTDAAPGEHSGRGAGAEQGICALCGRLCPLTFHHLIPRKLHRRAHFQKHFDKQALQRGIYLCRACHRGIHRLFDEMTLGRQFNTLAALQENPDVQRHVAWVAKQKGC